MSSSNPLTIGPGESVTIIYVGEQIPNQVVILNQSNVPGNFTIYGAVREGKTWLKQWGYFGTIEANAELGPLVNWPSNTAIIQNNSVAAATLSIGGPGIFPWSEN